MLTSIPVTDFIEPKRGSRPWNAVCRAIEMKPAVWLIGKYGRERFYRVQAKGHDRHCVIVWYDPLQDVEVARCDCEAHYVPHTPTHCYHVAAALIHEAIEPPKQASMGRRKVNGKSRTPRAQEPVQANSRHPRAGEVEGPDLRIVQ